MDPAGKETSKYFVFRHGRRYLREASEYPLPVDLPELNRQNLRTLLLMQVFGAPFCCKFPTAPTKVLEIACGSALWSSSCHEYLKSLGHDNVSFTGLDLAPLAPDLNKQGIDWTFVQHDLRKSPLPFKDGDFDFIFVNDGMVVFAADSNAPVTPLATLKKYLKPGGVVEIWDADLVFRCLLPESPNAPGVAKDDIEQARNTATYTVSAATPFTKAQNKYLQDYNKWLEAGFQKLGLSVTPCAILNYALMSEAEVPEKVGSRRFAIPLSSIHWEAAESSHRLSIRKQKSAQDKSGGSSQQIAFGAGQAKTLTDSQAAIRSTALSITIGLIESLEPILKKESGMKQDEWYRWWSSMTTNLLEQDGTANGECLDAGAWWVRK